MPLPLHTLSGSAVAVPTPLRDDRLDTRTLALLCERQIDRGTSAIIVCGSTGEAAALSAEEYALAVGAAVRAAAVGTSCRRVPVIAGCTASATGAAATLAIAAARAGADGLLCAAPPYVRPTQPGILAHIRAVAHAADLPVLLYDVPSRTGVAIADATVADLHQRGLIFGLKDATADLARPPRLRALCGPGLVQMTGDDATAAAYRAMGGAGCISVTANVAPMLCTLLHRAWDSGDQTAFTTLRDLLAPLHDALFLEPNPIPVKAALEQLGLCPATHRLPLTRATRLVWDRLAEVLARVMPAEAAATASARPTPRLAIAG